MLSQISMSALLAAVTLLSSAKATPTSLARRGIPGDVLAKLYLAHQYSAAAYCPNNNDNSSPKLKCPTGNCDIVQADNTSVLTQFQNLGPADSTGYVAIDHTRSKIILAYRGSESIQNFLADASFPLVPAPDICASCNAESGFYSFWRASKPTVLAALEQARAQQPSYTLDVIGHSLGAAAATIAAAHVRNTGLHADLYSFSSPRVGDPAFARYVSGQDGVSGKNYRVTHRDDWVPKVPLKAMGYLHVADEYWISSPNGVNVTTSDVEVFDGLEGEDYEGGNAGTKTTDLTFKTHEWIFDKITLCYPMGTIE